MMHIPFLVCKTPGVKRISPSGAFPIFPREDRPFSMVDDGITDLA